MSFYIKALSELAIITVAYSVSWDNANKTPCAPWSPELMACKSLLQVTEERGSLFLKQRAVDTGKFASPFPHPHTFVYQGFAIAAVARCCRCLPICPLLSPPKSLQSQTSQGRQRQTWVTRCREITKTILKVQAFPTPGLCTIAPSRAGTDLASSSQRSV